MLQRRKSTNAPYNLLFSKHRNMDVCCPQVTRRYEILSAMVYDCFSRKLKSLWFCDPSIKKLANNEHRFSLCIIVRASVKFIVTIVSRNGGGGHRACASKQKWPACSPPSDRSETNSSSLIVTRLVKQLGEQQERILASSVS